MEKIERERSVKKNGFSEQAKKVDQMVSMPQISYSKDLNKIGSVPQNIEQKHYVGENNKQAVPQQKIEPSVKKKLFPGEDFLNDFCEKRRGIIPDNYQGIIPRGIYESEVMGKQPSGSSFQKQWFRGKDLMKPAEVVSLAKNYLEEQNFEEAARYALQIQDSEKAHTILGDLFEKYGKNVYNSGGEALQIKQRKHFESSDYDKFIDEAERVYKPWMRLDRAFVHYSPEQKRAFVDASFNFAVEAALHGFFDVAENAFRFVFDIFGPNAFVTSTGTEYQKLRGEERKEACYIYLFQKMAEHKDSLWVNFGMNMMDKISNTEKKNEIYREFFKKKFQL